MTTQTTADLTFSVDTRVYRVAAVQKTAYRLAQRCTATIDTCDESRVNVTLLFRDGVSDVERRETFRLFMQELTDQELREKIGNETKAIRALIIAQAFSRTDLIGRE